MLNQFSRFQILVGEEQIKKLQNVCVAVFGIGGVGGYAVEALVRSGIGKIILIDNDKVSLTNLNRQIYALHSTIGKNKVDVAKARILDINPEIEVETHSTFYTKETPFDFSRFDYVIDAIDTVSSKISLVEECNKVNVPVISSMGAGNKMHPEMFEVSDIYKTSVCPLARVMRTELKKRGIKRLKVVYSKEKPLTPAELQEDNTGNRRTVPGSNAFVPSAAGLIIASEVIKDLIGYFDN